ncbi:MAG: DUF11 domain-containing protein, partial [Verrucomicrobiaceae bacterium]
LNLKAGKIDIKNSGVGNIKLRGKATDAIVKNSGVGSLEAGSLSQSVVFAVNVNSVVAAGLESISNNASISDDGENGVDANPADNSATETDSLNAAPDLLITTDNGLSSVTPGSTLSYSIAFRNQGNQGATGVILTQTLPAGTAFNANASTGGWQETTPGSGTFTLNIGVLAGGASGTATFTVTAASAAAAGQESVVSAVTIADDGGNGVEPTPADNITSQTTPLVAAPDLVISIDDGNTSTTPGSALSYTLTGRNQGNQDATGVVFTMSLPAGTSFNAAASTSGWTETSPGSGTFTFTVGALASGASGTATFAVTANAVAAAGRDSIVGSASIADDTLNGADPTPLDNSATDSTNLDAAPDLVVTTDNGLESTTPGSALNYTLTYSNQGNQDATGVVLRQTLPVGTAFDATASSAGWVETSPGSGQYTLSIGALSGATSGTAVFAVNVITPVISGLDQIVSTATVSDDLSNGLDPVTGNNTATDTDILDASPDLQVSITADTAIVKRGATVRYTVEYANVGDQNSSGVFLTQALPLNAIFNPGASTTGWTETFPGSGVFRFEVGDLPAGAQGDVIFAVKFATNLPGSFPEAASSASVADDTINGADPTPSDNTAGQTMGVYQGVYILAPGVPVKLKDAAPPTVRVFNISTGLEAFRFDAYDSSYRDSVRIAVGD